MVRTSTSWWCHRGLRAWTLSGPDRLELSQRFTTCQAFQPLLNLLRMELSHPARGPQTRPTSAFIARSGNSLVKSSLIRKAASWRMMLPMFSQLARTLSYRRWTCRMQSKSVSELSSSNWKSTMRVRLTQWTWMIWRILSCAPSMLLRFSIGWEQPRVNRGITIAWPPLTWPSKKTSMRRWDPFWLTGSLRFI
jgi:hypothetical protein